jgi:hypothetical protein
MRWGENVNYIKEDTRVLLGGNKEVGREVDTEKNKNMGISRLLDGGQYYNLMIVNKSFENVVKFRCFGNDCNKPSCIHEEMRSRPNLGNACCHSVQNLLFPSPL